MPRIVFKNNELPPVELHEPLVVGRSDKHANAVVRDSRLSRAHCRLERREEAWAVVDLESQNGTFLNGKRVKEARLKAGDVITIGAVDMLFESSGVPDSGIIPGASSPSGLHDSPDATNTMVAPAALVLIQGSLGDSIFPIVSDPFTIGRKPDNNLCLDNDGKSSGYHARIRRDGDEYLLEDLGSTNGCLVNGTRIEGSVVLKSGMKLLLGSQLFRFQLHGRPDESTGRTAPMSAAEMRRERDAQGGTINAAEAAEEEDRHALKQHVKFRGRSGALFSILEVLVVVLIAGAGLYAAWTMTTTGDDFETGGTDNFAPARDGGLLTSNPSFDDRDEAGFPRGWRYLVSGTDSFNLAEGARGGQYALQIGRFSAGNRVSVAISDAVEFKGAGVAVSVFALNPEFDLDRMGSALVQVHWLEHRRDRSPMLISPVAAATRMGEWTELSGTARAPQGATAFSIAVGISGTAGSVMFDDITVAHTEDAEDWMTEQSVSSDTGLEWQLSRGGELQLQAGGVPMIRGGRLLLFAVEGNADPLDPLHMLLAKPVYNRQGSIMSARYRYFDPLAGEPMVLQLELAVGDGAATLRSRIDAAERADVTQHARYLSFSGLATPQWIPGQVLRFAPGSDTPAEFVDEIGGLRDRTLFGRIVAADTGTGNSIEAEAAPTRAWVIAAPGGRELLLQNALSLALRFTPGTGQEALAQAIEKVGTTQPGEDQVDRVGRALSIMLEFPYNQAATAAAADAVEAASKHYRLRLIELRDGINVPQLTRNEQLYRSAMREAIATAERLRSAASRWNELQERVAAVVGAPGMNAASKQTASRAGRSLTELVDVADDFDDLAAGARKSLFLLEVEIEQRDSEVYMASARDFLDSGQYVQGMIKLSTVVRRYPRCLRGIEAKQRLADVAAILLDEMEAFRGQGMQNIALDRALQARDLIRTAQQHLLARLLTEQQKAWLADLPHSAEVPPSGWMALETDLSRRLLDLSRRLPEDLPEE